MIFHKKDLCVEERMCTFAVIFYSEKHVYCFIHRTYCYFSYWTRSDVILILSTAPEVYAVYERHRRAEGFSAEHESRHSHTYERHLRILPTVVQQPDTFYDDGGGNCRIWRHHSEQH